MDVKQILKERGFAFSKRYGQNFITDVNLLRAVAIDSGVGKDDVCVEIGAGAGTLTRELCAVAKRVVAYEIDERLKSILDVALSGINNCKVIFADVLKAGTDAVLSETGGKYKVAANLPYYITTPLIFFFLGDENCESLTVMVQKEVAERFVAPAGTAEYGAVSAQIALAGDVKITRRVSRNMFCPVPNVDSAVIRIDVKPKITDKVEREKVSRVIAAAFSMRRKTLANNLSSALNVSRSDATDAITALGFDASVRGEKLSVFDFIKLSSYISAKK